MLELLVYSGIALGTGLWSVYDSHRNHRLQSQLAASACGLTVEETSGFWSGGLRFTARAGPIQVRIFGPRRKDHGPQVVVLAPWPPGFAAIRIRPELDRPAGAREVEIGDPSFDEAFYIVGPMRLLFALLDAEARRLLLTANTADAAETVNDGNALQIAGGELRVEVRYPQMARTLRVLLEIAKRFSQPLDIAARLAENSRNDPEPEVRLQNLLLLARELPEQATEALRAACADKNPRIRLRAAQKLGAEGHGTLSELAESTEDDALSAQAVSSLGRALPLERTREILVQALRRRLLKTGRACLEAIGDSGGSGGNEDIDILTKVLEREKGDLAAAAAQALGTLGDPAAEPALLPALQFQRPDVRAAAAQALGRLGTAAAVLPLKEAAEQTRDQEIRSAFRQAIAEIQSRLQGASPGQLSLAGAEVGKLSLAEIEMGHLSLADAADRRD